MDKNKVLLIVDQLSQNTINCYISYKDKASQLDGVNIHGNNMTSTQLKEYFDKYNVGIDCVIEKLVFQPNDKEFLTTINNGITTCSQYAPKNEVEMITKAVNKLLK